MKSGDFKFERGHSAQKAKFDKKEVSVWQIPAGVGKPDFRHWADSVDLQLRAVPLCFRTLCLRRSSASPQR